MHNYVREAFEFSPCKFAPVFLSRELISAITFDIDPTPARSPCVPSPLPLLAPNVDTRGAKDVPDHRIIPSF